MQMRKGSSNRDIKLSLPMQLEEAPLCLIKLLCLCLAAKTTRARPKERTNGKGREEERVLKDTNGCDLYTSFRLNAELRSSKESMVVRWGAYGTEACRATLSFSRTVSAATLNDGGSNIDERDCLNPKLQTLYSKP
jgi:hypothetical protein